MEYNKLVSVVMPVHNGERFLREAIESVLAQTYTNFEFLIIENCSSDSSVEIIKSYNDPRITLIIEEDCGIVQAYNRGFKEAKGEFVLVHDQDDVSLKNRIGALIGFATEKKINVCGSAFEVINWKGKFIREIYPPSRKNEILNRILFDVTALFNPTLLIDKKVLEELNYFDYNQIHGADYDFVLRSFRKYKTGNFPAVLLKYRIHKNSTSRKSWNAANTYLKKISLKFYSKFAPFLSNKSFTLGRIYYNYGDYFSASQYFIKSIIKGKFTKEILKYFLFSTIFVIPISLARKFRFYNNRLYNLLLNQSKHLKER